MARYRRSRHRRNVRRSRSRSARARRRQSRLGLRMSRSGFRRARRRGRIGARWATVKKYRRMARNPEVPKRRKQDLSFLPARLHRFVPAAFKHEPVYGPGWNKSTIREETLANEKAYGIYLRGGKPHFMHGPEGIPPKQRERLNARLRHVVGRQLGIKFTSPRKSRRSSRRR